MLNGNIVLNDEISITGTGVQPHRNRKYIQFDNAEDCTRKKKLQFNAETTACP